MHADETPNGFLREFRLSVIKRRIGWIAIAIILAQAVLRLSAGITYNLLIPAIAKFFGGNSSSVLYGVASNPFPFAALFGTVLEFLLTMVIVFYLNLWALGRPLPKPGYYAKKTDEEIDSTLQVDLGSLAQHCPEPPNQNQ